ncbi:FHA domain-containing protein [Methanobacterium aggregans]|uniref:FHA domain-containing protein n=1 Tax=Methanobacterium aggregans TaxID=1615586 RepID=UPI00320D40E7
MSLLNLSMNLLLSSFTAVLLIFTVFNTNSVVLWLQNQWLDILFALLMALILGLAVEKIYKHFSPEPKILKNTLTRFTVPERTHGMLMLPNSEKISIRGAETVLGREDFLGVTSPDNLLFVGKEHLKIIRTLEGFFIEDLNTKNGTKINEHELKGRERVKLNDGDKIVVAKILDLEYREKI